MIHSYQTALGAMAALPLFLQPTWAAGPSSTSASASTSTPIPTLGASFVQGDTCKGVPPNPNFNATGSLKVKEFSADGSGSKDWTWHTGLQANATGGTPTQYFWVDTAGDEDLNKGELPYKLCLNFYYTLSDEVYAKAVDDNGNCEAMIGKECLDALWDKVRGGNCFDITSNLSDVPDACTALSKGIVAQQAMPFEFGPGDSDNETCGSTVDNPTGEKSSLFSVSWRNDTAQGTEVYDQAIKRAYFAIWTPFTTDGIVSKYGTQFMCFKNTDVAQGSKNSLPTPSQSGAPGPQQSKPGSSVKNSVSMVGLFAAIVGALIVFG